MAVFCLSEMVGFGYLKSKALKLGFEEGLIKDYASMQEFFGISIS